MTLYDVLEVSEYASEETIRAAYRALTRKYHPDADSSYAAQSRFTAVQKAYEVLGDIGARRRYDRQRHTDRRSQARSHNPPETEQSRTSKSSQCQKNAPTEDTSRAAASEALANRLREDNARFMLVLFCTGVSILLILALLQSVPD